MHVILCYFVKSYFISFIFRYMITGASFQSIGYSFRVAHNTIGKIVHETCLALWNTLLPLCLPKPSETLWKMKAERFAALWDFPYCLGALDGKHVRIQCPSRAGSLFFNYKQFHSIQLQAVVDADLMFVIIDVGEYGRNSDGAAFKTSSFGKALLNKELDIPNPSLIPGTDEEVAFHFVADEAYPLNSNIMRPFDGRNLNNTRRVFNQRLSRARKVVECAFGLLAKKWEIFQRPLRVHVANAETIIKVACALHNFVRARDGVIRSENDTENETAAAPSPRHLAGLVNWEKNSTPGRRPVDAIKARDALADFFMSEKGRLQWLNDLVCV